MSEMGALNEQLKRFMRMKLETDDRWALRALLVLHGSQTTEEQHKAICAVQNGIGFNKYDANILTSYAQQYLRLHRLSEKQFTLLKSLIGKYYNQMFKIANTEKLMAAYSREGEEE